MNTPAIYAITDYFKNFKGEVVYNSHYVAATSSEEAEAIFKAAKIPTTEAYIITDAFRDHGDDHNVLSYANTMTFNDTLTDQQHENWVYVITHSSNNGEFYPATHRKI